MNAEIPSRLTLRQISLTKTSKRLNRLVDSVLAIATNDQQRAVINGHLQTQQQYLIRLIVNQIEYSPFPEHHDPIVLKKAIASTAELNIQQFPRLVKALARAIEVRKARVTPNETLPWKELAKVAKASGPIVLKRSIEAARAAAGNAVHASLFEEALRETKWFSNRAAILKHVAELEAGNLTHEGRELIFKRQHWVAEQLSRLDLPLFIDLRWEIDRVYHDAGRAWASDIGQLVDQVEAEPIKADDLQEWIEQVHRWGPLSDHPTLVRRIHQLTAALAPGRFRGTVDGPTVWMLPATRNVDLGDVIAVDDLQEKVVGIGVEVAASECDVRVFGQQHQLAPHMRARYVFLQRISEAESLAMEEEDRALEAWVTRAMDAMA